MSLSNLDPSVAALLEPFDGEPSTSDMRTRMALMKLQQARIRGNSDYAAKVMDLAIEEGSKDRQTWKLLEEHIRHLDDQISAVENHTSASRNSNNETDPTETKDSKKGDENNSCDKDDEDDGITSEEVQKLKTQLSKEKERNEELEDHLQKFLEDELEYVKGEQLSLEERESSLKGRIKLLKASLQKLPNERTTKGLLNQLKEVQEKQCKLVNAECSVCQEQTATRAVIPCGHLALCDQCTKSILQLDSVQRKCPLCRGQFLSTLHIYTSK